ncbi:Z1 domain-containing protein [Facklamia sp. 7083-14-GEN3]|uniref:Z1 domain-containing protein n=1 Tax=Facklamia sp. 7083-14-GEN3 TaxID=2973478 RepID=UPI00215D5CC7|nr:Z1 domain-containing protein [Facklamia sp. 7083-14-GEN3]MCR8968460.1 Z1 domain-containing protein [Facklamia sp. 7083-14-GEN3]
MNNYNDVKYNKVKRLIEDLIDNGNSIEKIRSFTIFSDDNPEESFEKLGSVLFGLDINSFALDNWKELVDFMTKEPEKPKGLFNGAINDFEVSHIESSQWKQYKNLLINKNFTTDAINEIECSCKTIVQQLSKNTLETEATKGLVVGNVQSGKTANMVGVISMAADYGFNFFIIFTGIIDSLRRQTQSRIFKDLNLDSKHSWVSLNNPSLRSDDDELNWENIKVGLGSNKKYFTVGLKNKKRMEDLLKWLYSDENKTKQLKVLVIDDEADQASINTKDINQNERTTINNLLLKIVNGYNDNKISAMNYISYTATPFANVLNETEGLFPKDFIISLKAASDYIGPREIFGLQEPESTPRIPIIYSFSDNENIMIDSIHNFKSQRIPNKLKEALTWYIIAASIYRLYGIRKPVSMLIHTSYKIDHHEAIYNVVKSFLFDIKNNQQVFLDYAEGVYDRITLDFTIDDFKLGMEKYSSKDKIKDYPEFKKIKRQIINILDESGNEYLSNIPLDEDGVPKYHNGFHLVMDNSKSESIESDQEIRLIYPSKISNNRAPMFIVIGGNTLSRGLTLEGLVSTYFLRNTKQADTLLQMGRWFGYRKGYELLPRVWMDGLTRDRFQYIAQINEELSEEIEMMNMRGESPKDFGVRVRNSPDNAFLQLTAANKRQSASGIELDFSGIDKQTTIFKDDYEELTHNLNLTIQFIKSLHTPRESVYGENNLVWEGISFNKIKNYLKNFKFSNRAIFFNNIELMIEWFEKNQEQSKNNFPDFNVVLVSKGSSDSNYLFEVNGTQIYPVTRSKKYDVDQTLKVVSIGNLTLSDNILLDIENKVINKTSKKSELLKIRRQSNLGNVPQLAIYIIDKDSKPQKSNKDRRDLEFSQHIVGINIFIPGVTNKRKNLAQYLKIPIRSIDMEENSFEE